MLPGKPHNRSIASRVVDDAHPHADRPGYLRVQLPIFALKPNSATLFFFGDCCVNGVLQPRVVSLSITTRAEQTAAPTSSRGITKMLLSRRREEPCRGQGRSR